jgi:hypothetical protein
MKLRCSYVAVTLQMFISKLAHLTITVLSINQHPDPIIKLVASVVPILNGKDSEGNVICLGPESTKIHRYLLVVFLAKSTQMFRLLGREIDNSIYFTLYKLWQVANSFKDISPYHLPIRYDRTKVAIKVYNMISNTGLVAVRKIEGDTYVTITEKGDDVSTKLLQNFIAYGELTNMNKTYSEEKFKMKKGGKFGVGPDPGLQRVEKRLAERISEINLPFEDELRTIEED